MVNLTFLFLKVGVKVLFSAGNPPTLVMSTIPDYCRNAGQFNLFTEV